MLSSIRSRRRFILASVKFLSRALTALNLEPSMATLATFSKSSSRHSATKVRQTSRIALTDAADRRREHVHIDVGRGEHHSTDPARNGVTIARVELTQAFER